MKRRLSLVLVALAAARCGARGDLADTADDRGDASTPASGGSWAAAGGGGMGWGAFPGGSGSASGGGHSGSGGQSGGTSGLDAASSDATSSGATGGGGKKLKLPVADAAPPKDSGGPGYEVIDGGHDCELEDIGAVFAYQTCCNGKLCRGQCVVFDGQTAPVCYCASLVGGCPAPHHCCMGTHCNWSDYCT